MQSPLAAPQLTELDATLRETFSAVPAAAGFSVLLQYPMGWVEADGAARAQAGGKRVRPLLLLLCAEAAGGDWQAALPAAAAVEILHNFSLVHDDIEDASPLRHGRPTVWKLWGIGNAINSGDALFALSFAALTRLTPRVPETVVHKALAVFSAMTIELTRGQHLDMRFETQEHVTIDEYLSMIEGKSAALLAASAEIGALIGSGSTETAGHYRAFGLNLGLAFQIRDDILGIWGDSAITGKSAATDILSRKKSLPALFGLERSADLRALYARETFGEDEVREAVRLLDQLDARAYAAGLEAEYHRRALAALGSAAPASPAAEALKSLLDRLLGRAA